MMLLEIGEILEEWTHKKSVEDLARTMAIHVDKVWLLSGDKEILVPCDRIQENDCIHIHMGNVIPFDGQVESGEAMVNQASLTGEPLPVCKAEGSSVFAGTVAEEGSIVIRVKQGAGSSRYEKIITMIEESEKLKSNLESRAERLADRLVPYTFLGTGLVYALTRDVTRALSVLMVDFSCALKLAMPISVLSAIRESGKYSITVKGGKFLEAMAETDTIVFDKTGTLTKAAPRVADVVAFGNWDPQEALRIAACLEEHFPHSIARAVVEEAAARDLHHEEMHSEVDYRFSCTVCSGCGCCHQRRSSDCKRDCRYHSWGKRSLFIDYSASDQQSTDEKDQKELSIYCRYQFFSDCTGCCRSYTTDNFSAFS